MAEITSEVVKVIKKYIQALEQQGVHTQQVFLYGSHAKKTAHAHSDIDLIIVSKNFVGKSLFERLHILGDTRWTVQEPIQAYGFTPEKIQNRDLSAFWEETIEIEAVPLTDDILNEAS